MRDLVSGLRRAALPLRGAGGPRAVDALHFPVDLREQPPSTWPSGI